MHRRTLIAVSGAIVIAVAIVGTSVALAASTGPSVTVTVKNGNKTLVERTVRGETGWVTKGGTPKGKCSGNTAAGALDAATHGKWTATYYASVPGIFVDSIDGVKPKGHDYWGISVNGKSSSKGACAIKLRVGEKLLFKVVK